MKEEEVDAGSRSKKEEKGELTFATIVMIPLDGSTGVVRYAVVVEELLKPISACR